MYSCVEAEIFICAELLRATSLVNVHTTTGREKYESGV